MDAAQRLVFWNTFIQAYHARPDQQLPIWYISALSSHLKHVGGNSPLFHYSKHSLPITDPFWKHQYEVIKKHNLPIQLDKLTLSQLLQLPPLLPQFHSTTISPSQLQALRDVPTIGDIYRNKKANTYATAPQPPRKIPGKLAKWNQLVIKSEFLTSNFTFPPEPVALPFPSPIPPSTFTIPSLSKRPKVSEFRQLIAATTPLPILLAWSTILPLPPNFNLAKFYLWIWNITASVTESTNHWKLITKSIITQKQLFTLQHSTTPNCLHCNILDSHIHRFFECEYTMEYWVEINYLLHRLIPALSTTYNLTNAEIIYGLPNLPAQSSKSTRQLSRLIIAISLQHLIQYRQQHHSHKTTPQPPPLAALLVAQEFQRRRHLL